MKAIRPDTTYTQAGLTTQSKVFWHLVELVEELVKEGVSLKDAMFMVHDSIGGAVQTVMNRQDQK